MTASVRAIAVIIVVLIGLLTVAAMLVWLERRLLGLVAGPLRAEPRRPVRPLADARRHDQAADQRRLDSAVRRQAVFVIAPAVIMVTVLMAFAVVPFAPAVQIADLNIGLLFFLGMSSLGVYSVVLAGWSSDNKYALIGSAARRRTDARLRGLHGSVADGRRHAGRTPSASRASWRRSAGCGSASRRSSACSCSRTRAWPRRDGCRSICQRRKARSSPDITSEYSGMKFGMFFIGEYLGITLISAMVVTLFFGGWLRAVASADRLVRAEDLRAHLRLHPASGHAAAAAVRSTDGVRLEGDAAARAAEPGRDRRDCGGRG